MQLLNSIMEKLLIVLLVSSSIAFFNTVQGFDAYKVIVIYPMGYCYRPPTLCFTNYTQQSYYMTIHGFWPVHTTNPPTIPPPLQSS
jgi:hypothetical protein